MLNPGRAPSVQICRSQRRGRDCWAGRTRYGRDGFTKESIPRVSPLQCRCTLVVRGKSAKRKVEVIRGKQYRRIAHHQSIRRTIS
jgi:hypothetical protein